ncbi:type II toxin-antitoxin system death-on-curing family toxin [Mycobacterium adipatum]|jgi:death-on-curing family protein|uniref:type II toxin-antitoxin system death-on-curing family toxin n=1 Tax=Mycobacterium adipatum TaxID=1682113 RepID=UPI0034E09ADE
MTIYLTVQQILDINADQVGTSEGADIAGIEQSVGRPRSGVFDREFYPDIWSKAAAYLEGLARHQYFLDGNKRTGWHAAVTFLRLNGVQLPLVPAIEAEAFVQAVAQDVFSTLDAPEMTVQKAAEWLRVKWASQRVGPAIDPRLEFVFLAQAAQPADDMESQLNIFHAGMTGAHLRQETDDPADLFPVSVPFSIVGRFHWRREDLAGRRLLKAHIVPLPGGARIARPRAQLQCRQPPPSGHARHTSGLLPMYFQIGMIPSFTGPCEATVRLELDGVLLAELPFRMRVAEVPPETLPDDWS